MTMTEIRQRVETDPDYINLKRFDFSLRKLLVRYPDGCPDHIIAQALILNESEVETTYNNVVIRLRTLMGVRD